MKKKKTIKEDGKHHCYLRINLALEAAHNNCSWPPPFQNGSLIGYLYFNETVSVPDCTEPINTQHSMQPKWPASFASLERIESRCAYIQSTLRRSGCFFIFCGLNLGLSLIFKSCVWDFSFIHWSGSSPFGCSLSLL